MTLGEWVNCTAYLKPVRDGVYIEKIDGKLTESGEDDYVIHPKDWKLQVFLSPCEGAYDVEKTYYERKEKRFKGVVVGTKEVITEAYLGVDTDTDFRGYEHQRIFKEAKTTVKCALVFFSMGRSRLVPLDDLNFERSSKE